MAIGSGLASQFGYAAESTWGTGVTVTKFPRVRSAVLSRDAQRVQGEGIQSGIYGPLGSHYVETTTGASATVAADVTTRGWGAWFQQLMGATGSSAQQGGSAAYLQTFALGDPYGKSLTVQAGRPTRAGTVVPATVVGAKILSTEFACSAGELLTMSSELDGKAWDNTTALASASYLSAAPFHWAQMAVKLGTYGAESAVSGVRGMSVTIERPMDTEDYTANGAGVKGEPVLNGLANITGTFTVDWLAKATFEDVAATTASTSLVWEFVSTTAIAATYYPTWRLVLPGITFEPNTQGVDGPSELTSDWPFTWRYDGTNLPKVEYMTADTTI